MVSKDFNYYSLSQRIKAPELEREQLLYSAAFENLAF